MSEYWKSTPTYWCKFCSQYVRDTGIERKNHEASARHQNNIQRSLRELHKGQERESREKQRAKDEVARLNGMFSDDAKAANPTRAPSHSTSRAQPPLPPNLTTAQQRKAHAEQLAALGVKLPEELKKEVTGVGDYQVVDAREVEPTPAEGSISVNRPLGEILAEMKRKEQQTVLNNTSTAQDASRGVHKRKAEDEDDVRDEEAAPKRRKAWGSNVKSYPGKQEDAGANGDLDALLSGVKKRAPKTEAMKAEDGEEVKREEGLSAKPLDTVPDISEAGVGERKKSEEAVDAPPAVIFKKRKGKR